MRRGGLRLGGRGMNAEEKFLIDLALLALIILFGCAGNEIGGITTMATGPVKSTVIDFQLLEPWLR
jgi:hypothetical protein